MIYSCCDELRAHVVRQTPALNGIDFLEVIDSAAPTEADRQRFLTVHFVKPLGTSDAWRRAMFASRAASASQNIKVLDASTGVGAEAHVLTVEVDQARRFLALHSAPGQRRTRRRRPGRRRSAARRHRVFIQSRMSEPVRLRAAICLSARTGAVPDIDYLAKDFASFRR